MLKLGHASAFSAAAPKSEILLQTFVSRDWTYFRSYVRTWAKRNHKDGWFKRPRTTSVWSTWPCILTNITVCFPHFLMAKCLNLRVTSPLETATSQRNQVTNYTSLHIITAVLCLLVVQNEQSRHNTTAPRMDNPPAVETKKPLIDHLHDTPDTIAILKIRFGGRCPKLSGENHNYSLQIAP